MNKQIKWGVILQYLQMALSIIINLCYTPVMLNLLGQNEYGIYNLVSSIISYLSLLSLGFGAGYIRFYSKYKANNDEEAIKKLNGLYLVVFFVLGAISLIAGLFISFNCGIFFNSSYSTADLEIARTLMIFLSINLALSFPASVFTSYITSQEKFIWQKLLNIGKTVLSPCLCIAVLFMGYGSIGMVIVTTIVSITIDLFNLLYCFFKLKMKVSFGKFDKALFKEIFIFCLFIAINQIIDQINWQTDKIILGKMVNGTAVAIYAVSSTINSMYLNFSTAISNVFAPRVNMIVSKKESDMDDQLTSLFIKVGRIQYFVIMLILTGFIFFGQYFTSVWAGEEYYLSYYVALLLICPVTIPLIQNIGIEIQRAKNQHKFRSIVYLIMAVFNVILSIILCRFWGVIGVTVGTAVSLVVCNGLIMNVYYHKVTKINMLKFWKEILKATLSMIIPIIVGVIIMLLVELNSFWEFFGYVVLYTFVYCIFVYLLGLNKQERNLVNQPFIMIWKKLRGSKSNKISIVEPVKGLDATTESKTESKKEIGSSQHLKNIETEKVLANGKVNCCGCGACANICPKRCITMQEDEEGFLYPKIDYSKCIKCGLCLKVCPILTAKPDTMQVPKVYACKNKNKEILTDSSSGGIFYLLAEEIIKQGGVVYSAKFVDAYTVAHCRVDKLEDLHKLRKSKYLQSVTADIFPRVKEDLLSGKKVLFTGTGCQIEGLQNYLMKPYENLYTQDIICHGVPSPKTWKLYLQSEKITKDCTINFRDKQAGWKDYCLKITKDNEILLSSHHKKNEYMRTFLSDCNIRPSCYDCKFKHLHRNSDITLADFWGIEKSYPEFDSIQGVSAVFIHSKKGAELFASILNKIESKEVTFDSAVKYNQSYFYSAKSNKNRAKFFKNLTKRNFKRRAKKYCMPTKFDKLKSKLRSVLKKLLKK